MSSPNEARGDATRVAHAFAKVNLGLRVLERRPDGYHEIDTILQTIDLSDRLTFTTQGGDRLNIRCSDPDIPQGPHNLVWKALDALRSRAGRRDLGMGVEIEKGIPAGAGLGGGSSDAACALAVASAMWDLGLSRGELAEIGAQLGSDVPFFLTGGTCRARGRGELIDPLEPLEGVHLGLVVPPVQVETARVYMRFNLPLTRKCLNASIVQQLISAGVSKELADLLENDLEATALDLFPELRMHRDRLRALGIPIVRMSGSGGTFYFWPVEAGLVEKVEAVLQDTGSRVLVVRTTRKGSTEGDP